MARRMTVSPKPPRQTARLMRGNTVVMAKTNEDSENDLSTDIAGAVGKTIGNIVNRIEALDSERQELITKLSEARTALNEQFNRWLPAGFTGTPPKQQAAEPRADRKQRSCKICLSLGLTDLANGHISRGHDKWLQKQTNAVKARVNAAQSSTGEFGGSGSSDDSAISD